MLKNNRRFLLQVLAHKVYSIFGSIQKGKEVFLPPIGKQSDRTTSNLMLYLRYT